MKDFFAKYARWILPEPNSGCWIWTGVTTTGRKSAASGYGWVRQHGDMLYCHRAAYEATHGRGAAAGWVVRHTCDIPCCVNPDHLLIGTIADNSRDMVERGRSLCGERATTAKLKERDVIEIMMLDAFGFRQDEIGAQFGIDQSAVSLIVRGKRWAHLKEKAMNATAKTSPALGKMIRANRRALRQMKRGADAITRERCWLALKSLTEMETNPLRPGLAAQVAINVVHARAI